MPVHCMQCCTQSPNGSAPVSCMALSCCALCDARRPTQSYSVPNLLWAMRTLVRRCLLSGQWTSLLETWEILQGSQFIWHREASSGIWHQWDPISTVICWGHKHMLEGLNENCGNNCILWDLLSKGLNTRSAWETGVQQKDVGFGKKQDSKQAAVWHW